MSKQIIDQLYNLYITQTKKYLIQHSGGGYSTGKKKLVSYMMDSHLQGKYTVGTFAGDSLYVKFITFDVDYSDPHMAKWITYKISETLTGYNLDHHISFSGSKGYHIDIFIDDLIALKSAVKFYDLILNVSGVKEHSDEGNKVEFRPTDGLGVKLPMGFHQKTKAYCGFCLYEDGLKVMSKEESEQYCLSITKIKRQKILDVIGQYEIDEIAITDKKKLIESDESLSQYDGSQYDITEDERLDKAIDLLRNGLKVRGTRHKAIREIAGYLKYTGLEQDETEQILIEWMDRQDKSKYSTPLNDCYEDIKELVQWVYDKDYQVRPINYTVEVTLNEINTIIEKCPEKNQKLILYAMLIHSKRLATMQGVFFMSRLQLEKLTGLGEATAYRQIQKLMDLGLVELVKSGRKEQNANHYKIKLNADISDKVFETDTHNNFRECALYFFDHKELKKLFPRRQFESLIG